MKNECCGRIIRSQFCPFCGKEASGSASLIGMLENELALAKKNEDFTLRRLDEKNIFYREQNRKRNETALVTIRAIIKRIEGWIEFVKSASE